MRVESDYRGATVLVTGGAGAIGSCVVTALVAAGARRIVVVDDLSSGYRWNVADHSAVEFWQRSILDESLVDELAVIPWTHVFHLAAFFANQNSVEHPQQDLLANGLGTMQMLEVARRCPIQRFVYASSSSSFSKVEAPLPLTEDFLSLKLDTPYQISKLLGEYYGHFYYQHWGVPTVAVRLFNSFGPGEVPGKYRNVIPNFVYRALRGEPLPITGTGEETRDFTYVDDIVSGILAAGTVPDVAGEAFNLASARETRVIELANHINALTGNQAGVRFQARRDWDRTSRRWAAIEKAQKRLGYQPRTQLAHGLEQTVLWFRDHWDLIDASMAAPELANVTPQAA